MSQHLLYALVYDREIAALSDGLPTRTGTSAKLRSHIQLLLSNTGYKAAYYDSSKHTN